MTHFASHTSQGTHLAYLRHLPCIHTSFNVVPQVNPKFSSQAGSFPEPAASMFVLKQSVHTSGVPLGDSIPLSQLHALADLIPRFDAKADP